MTYTKEQFLADVKAEAKALRQHATKEELEKIIADRLNPRDDNRCIYGLATGNCFSVRAAELIHKCGPRYFKNSIETDTAFESITDSQNEGEYALFVNGEKPAGIDTAEDLYRHRAGFGIWHYSTLEVYIMQPFADNTNLISYLRGETDDLNL